MGQITAIAPTYDGVLVSSALSTIVHTSAYVGVSVSADALGPNETAEEVAIYIIVGGTAKALTNASGTVQKLTENIPALHLEGGPTYRFAKTATQGECGVYVDFKTP